MNNLMNKTWWIAAGTRAIKTICQTAVALLGTDAIGILEVNWIAIASASLLAGIVSILTSIAGIPEVEFASHKEEIEFDKGGGDDGFTD